MVELVDDFLKKVEGYLKVANDKIDSFKGMEFWCTMLILVIVGFFLLRFLGDLLFGLVVIYICLKGSVGVFKLFDSDEK